MQRVEELYRAWLFELWGGDFAVAERIIAADAVGHWPAQDVVGPEGFVAQVRMSHEMFDDIRTTLDVGPIVDGAMLAARWSFHGRYRGGVPGATAEAGTPVTFAGHDLFRVTGGMLAEYWVISDTDGLMRRLTSPE